MLALTIRASLGTERTYCGCQGCRIQIKVQQLLSPSGRFYWQVAQAIRFPSLNTARCSCVCSPSKTKPAVQLMTSGYHKNLKCVTESQTHCLFFSLSCSYFGPVFHISWSNIVSFCGNIKSALLSKKPFCSLIIHHQILAACCLVQKRRHWIYQPMFTAKTSVCCWMQGVTTRSNVWFSFFPMTRTATLRVTGRPVQSYHIGNLPSVEPIKLTINLSLFKRSHKNKSHTMYGQHFLQ